MATPESAKHLSPPQPHSVVDPTSARSSYREILRSSAIIGGSSALNLIVGIARTKAMAVLLGPAGVGLMGALTSITDLARSVAGLGISSSGVRQVAEATASDDGERVAATVKILRTASLVLGLAGAAALALVSEAVASATFGDTVHAGAVAVVAATLLFRLVSDGQTALLQGMRRIGDVARVNTWGAVLGSAASVAVVYWLREPGIAWALVTLSATTMVVSWHFSRRVIGAQSCAPAPLVRSQARQLLAIGIGFMSSAMATLAAAYLVRIIVIRSEGLEASGLYQAAWAIGGMFVAFVLQAMGTDFYPRLVAAASDDTQCNRLVNEQAFVSVLLSGAGVVGTITFAPFIVQLLYSVHFASAADVLRWICLGMAMRVATWPLGYILVAKGKTRLFVGADVFWSVVNVALTAALVPLYGVAGAGIAFFGSYVIHLMVVWPVCRSITGFRWSRVTGTTAIAMSLAVGSIQAANLLLPAHWALVAGCVALALTSVASLLVLRSASSSTQLPGPVARVLDRWVSQ